MLKNLMVGCSLLALSVGGLSAVPGDANEARVGVAKRKKASDILPQPVEEALLEYLLPSQSLQLEGLFADPHVDYEGFKKS